MRKYRSFVFVLLILLVAMSMQACSSVQEMISGTPTSTPTITPTFTLTPSPTSTPIPTSTNTPTATPDIVATQEYEAFLPLIDEYYTAGKISSTDGDYYRLDDYSDSLADLEHYQWATLDTIKTKNFLLKTKLTMSTANKYNANTGCGFVFDLGYWLSGIFISQDGTASYMGNNTIYFEDSYLAFPNPAEIEVILVLSEETFMLYIDGREALVFHGGEEKGNIGYAVISGSDEDYGSRCEFTNTQLWVMDE